MSNILIESDQYFLRECDAKMCIEIGRALPSKHCKNTCNFIARIVLKSRNHRCDHCLDVDINFKLQ